MPSVGERQERVERSLASDFRILGLRMAVRQGMMVGTRIVEFTEVGKGR